MSLVTNDHITAITQIFMSSNSQNYKTFEELYGNIYGELIWVKSLRYSEKDDDAISVRTQFISKAAFESKFSQKASEVYFCNQS